MRFTIIKLKKLIVILVIFFLVMSFSVLLAKNLWNFMKKNPRLYLDIEEEILKNTLPYSLPVFKFRDKNRQEGFTISSIVQRLFYIATNLDYNEPKSYVYFHLPLACLTETKMAMTPGIEILPEKQESMLEKPQENIEKQNVDKIKYDDKKPLILIYHTHTTESFTPSEKYNFNLKDNSYHTEDLRFTVVKVGEILTQELKDLGINTIHDKTIHDIPTYMTSYSNSYKTVEKIVKENPSIEIIIDLHRDAPIKDPSKSRELTTVNIEGKTYSRIMFVIGTDGNFPHPHWKENHEFSIILNKKAEEMFPGISRGIDLRKERFNQHLSKKAFLIEIGSHGNTLDEAIETARVFARVLKKTIDDINESQN